MNHSLFSWNRYSAQAHTFMSLLGRFENVPTLWSPRQEDLNEKRTG